MIEGDRDLNLSGLNKEAVIRELSNDGNEMLFRWYVEGYVDEFERRVFMSD
jgi:hypothetical protein